MKSIIGVYNNHQQAVQAIQQLQKAGLPTQHLSILGQAKNIDNHIHVSSSQVPEGIEISVGVVAGSILGILTGVGIFAIPGLGFLYGAGALIGAFAGADLGLIGGGLAAILTNMGVDKAVSAKYERLLKEGKFMLVVQGTEEEIKKAEDTLKQHGTHVELDTELEINRGAPSPQRSA